MQSIRNLKRITHVDDVKPNDLVLIHCTTDSKHVDGLRFTFAPCRVIEHRQNTMSRRHDAIPVLDQFGRFDWITPSDDECYLMPAPEISSSTYPADSDSPFDEMLRAWINDNDVLRCYDVYALDEMLSCASSLLRRPTYERDELLSKFESALDAALNSER
jgi:hypothetical protein